MQHLRKTISSTTDTSVLQPLLLLQGDGHRCLAGVLDTDNAAAHWSAALSSYLQAAGSDSSPSPGAAVAAQQAQASMKLALLCNDLLRVCPSVTRAL